MSSITTVEEIEIASRLSRHAFQRGDNESGRALKAVVGLCFHQLATEASELNEADRIRRCTT